MDPFWLFTPNAENEMLKQNGYIGILTSIVVSTGEMIVASSKYHVQDASKSMYETQMTLVVRKFQKDDVGSYRCIAKNSLGEVDSSIRLYGEYKKI